MTIESNVPYGDDDIDTKNLLEGVRSNKSKTQDDIVNNEPSSRIASEEPSSVSMPGLLPRSNFPLLVSMAMNVAFSICLFILFLGSMVNSDFGLSTANRKPNATAAVGMLSADNRKQSGVVFGHVHIPKTAGTELNGLLASRFERVCGHKGYSYDAYQFNKREEIIGGNHTEKDSTGDLVNKQKKRFNRGRVPGSIMWEIGFEDCDYVSLETGWQVWKNLSKNLGASMELHVPCREPVNHLMSMCNHRNIKFSCTGNLSAQVDRCLLGMKRFKGELAQDANLDLKCFNPIPIDPYMQYMGERLQWKRKENEYIHRDTNQFRDKDKECIWKMPEAEKKVRDILVHDHEFFHWCNTCVGTENDLLLGKSTKQNLESQPEH